MKRPVLGVALALLALFVLLWTRQETHYVGPSDAANYLAAARSGHVLYDQRPYVIHPPAYPLAIRALAVLTRDETRAALLLGLLCEVALVPLTFLIALELSKGRRAPALLGALLLVFTHGLAYHAQGIFREPWQVLLVHLAVLVVLKGSARAAPLGAPLALTWDPIGVAAPLFALSGFVVKRRKPAAALAAVIAVSWLSWAVWRWQLVASGPTYPAGIDGMVEETKPYPIAAFVNPNFFPETKRHNAYFWPRHATPDHLVQQVGPNLLAEDVLYADYQQPAAFLAAGTALLALAALGAVVAAPRPLLAWALPVCFLGAPGVLGNTGRYSLVMVPLACSLAGLGLEHLIRRKTDGLEERPGLLLALALVPAVATVATHPVCSFVRKDIFETRSVAAVVSGAAKGAKVAAYVGWPPELCWLLPESRVVALPFRAERVGPFLDAERPDFLVVPIAVRAPDVPAADLSQKDTALGLPALREIQRLVGTGALVRLGVSFEAETSDRARLHAYVVLWRAQKEKATPAPFRFHFASGESADAARALATGGCDPAEAQVFLEATRR